MAAPKIQVNADLINDIANKILLLRNETSSVLNKVDVLAGGPNWTPGADLKAKLLAIGNQLDSHFVKMDQNLDHYIQVLHGLLRDSDDTESNNIFLGQFMGQ
jgi:hypothetical protein